MDEELSRYVIEELEGLEDGVRQGSGSFGSVYKVRINGMPCIAKRLHDILTNRQVAVSGANSGDTIKERFRTECLLLSRIRHPNIVQFLGVHYGPNSSDLTLVLEHLHMDLEQCFATYPQMPLSIKLGVLEDVSYGLLHLHTRKPPIVHRDLTASNILVTPDMRAKIADLGVSRLLDVSPLQLSNFTACPGTLQYMPPEALRPEPSYDVRLDIFSFGVVALFAANQEFPNVYYGIDVPDGIQQDGKSELYKRRDAMDKLSTSHCLYELIVQCLSDDPEKRPTSVGVNRKMKELCVNLPKRFPSVLEMHREIWKLHGEREQLAKQLSKEQSTEKKQTTSETEKQLDEYMHQIQSLRQHNESLWRKKQELEERIKELEGEQSDLTPQQQTQSQQDDDVCPLPGPSKSPNRSSSYVNVSLAIPSISPVHHIDTSTPVNPPYVPRTDLSRNYYDQPSLTLTEPLDTDIRPFPGNGHPSGNSSGMSYPSSGSQPGSAPALDPNLKCTGCGVQFREGEIQEFKRHSSACDKVKSQRLQYTSPDDDGGYREDFHTAEQKYDPNLTCIGCNKGFKETQIQEFSKHCRSCQLFTERVRAQSESHAQRQSESADDGDDQDPRSQSYSGGTSKLT